MSGRRSSSRVDDAVELVVGVGQAGEVALVDDRGGEARLGEDHHAGGRLDQVRAGARADHQEEGVLDLAVQPDDAGQAAEDLALAALAQHRRRVRQPQPVTSACAGGAFMARSRPVRRCRPAASRLSSRAARSFSRNCVALIDVGRIGGERQQHLLARRRAQPVASADEIGGVQRQHQHAEDVFPEEGRREQVAAEDHLFPDGAGDHDRVEAERLDDDRDGRGRDSLRRSRGSAGRGRG